MKILATKRALLTLLVVGSWIMGKSQQSADSLLNYLEIAARNNPTVLQRFYEYEAALQKVPQVGSLPDPDVSLGVFLSPMELVNGNQLADVRLMQMFPWFGVLKSAKDEMSLMAKARYESLTDAKLSVFIDVQRSWYELNKLNQNIRISRRNIEILQSIERLAIVKFKAVPGAAPVSTSTGSSPTGSVQPSASANSGMQTMGGASPGSSQVSTPMQSNSMGSSNGLSGLTDIYRIQIEIADVQNSIELINNQIKSKTAEFNAYLDRPPDSKITLPDTLVLQDYQPSLWVLPDTSFTNNPMLGMIRYEQQSLDARKQMVTNMSYPMIGIGVNYSLINKSTMSTSSMNGKDMVMPMVTATLPIYRKKYKAMQSEVDLLKSASAQNYNATVNSLQTEYFQAMQLFQDSERRLQLYQQQSELASKSLNIMLKSFTSSSVDLSDILRVRQQLLDYEYKQVEAIADHNISIAWLKRLLAIS